MSLRRGRLASVDVLCAALLLGGAACRSASPAAAPAEEADAAPAVQDGGLHGVVSSRYRGRRSGGDEDHDLLEVVQLDWAGAGAEPARASVLGRVRADLDGGREGDDPFFSVADTRGGDVTGELYRAQVAFPLGGPLREVRAGRLLDAETPETAWYDGAALESRERGPRALSWSAYGGRAVHLYESDSGGDTLAGAALDARPWRGARARLDWMHFEDRRGDRTLADDLYAASLHQVVDERWTVFGEASGLDDGARDARLGAAWTDDGGWFVQVAHREQFQTLRERSLEVDPFFTTLRTLFPYRTTTLLATRELGRVDLELGTEVRRVVDQGDVGEFNRDYDRAWGTLRFPEALPSAITPAVTAERWDGTGDDVEGLGFELLRELGAGERIALGTSRALYKVDLFGQEERTDVRTWYLRWRRSARAARGQEDGRLGFDLAYEYEDGADETHNLRAGLTWRF